MIKMFEQYVSSRSISMGLKLNEMFITDASSLKGKDLSTYNKLKFKMGDLVVLTKAYFDKPRSSYDDEIFDDDERLEDINSIFTIEFIQMGRFNVKGDETDSYYIRDIRDKSQKLINNNVAWVTEDEIESCPQWRLDAQNYNL